MNDLERFKAIIHFEKPDYIPIFAFYGAPGVSHGAMQKTHQRLIETGMPEDVGESWGIGYRITNLESWHQYWGTTGPIGLDFFPGEPAKGLKSWERVEGEFEIIENEAGAITRQVIDNDVTYSMPEFIRFPVRDKKSWEFYRDRVTPGKRWDSEKIEKECARFKNRTKPLVIGVGPSWGGTLRGLLGPEKACTIFYDEPELANEILEWSFWINKNYTFPLIEILKPEIISIGEDICYKSGMLISPTTFNKYLGPYYEKIAEFARECGVELFTIDSDGNIMEYVETVEKLGVNGIYPCEVKAGNDLFLSQEKVLQIYIFRMVGKRSLK